MWGGLKWTIQEKIPLHTIVTLDDAINKADQIEQSTGKSSKYASTSTVGGVKEGQSISQVGGIVNAKIRDAYWKPQRRYSESS